MNWKSTKSELYLSERFANCIGSVIAFMNEFTWWIQNTREKSIFVILEIYMTKILGIVEQTFIKKAGGDPYAFLIRGEDNQTYFTHIGDLFQNENKLYKDLNIPTEFLQKGDKVEFDCFTPNIHLLAIHVKKKDKN